MRTFAKFLLTLVVALSVFAVVSSAQVDPASNGGRIKGIQKISAVSGIAYTASAVYRTADDGASWSKLPLPLEIGSVIAGVRFVSDSRGWALIHDRGDALIRVAETRDGGNSWETLSASTDIFGEDTYLDEAVIRVSGRELSLTFRIPTSSNFEGHASFRSIDGGTTWTQTERVVELRRSDEPQPVRSRDWSVRTEGSCAEAKRGCIQETTIVNDSGRDLTPSEIVDANRDARIQAARAAGSEPLLLAPGGSVRTSLNRGFDKCTAASVAQLQTWWNTSPYYDVNIYMSGRNRACTSQPFNGNPAWLVQVAAQGWGMIPTIVGYQSPCTASTTTAKLSYDPAVSEQQGRGEADIAVADAIAIGLTAGSVLYYDMERYDETVNSPGCRTATVAFLKGWTERVHELGYISGVYGSPKNAQEDWMNMPAQSKMDAVWLANWDNRPTVWTFNSFPSFPTSVWTNHQRIKQYFNGTETWGGVTFNIDGDVSDGPVAGVAVAKNKNSDFDGDGKADISVFRPSNGVWYIFNSATSTVTYSNFGIAGDLPVPGDYDGDGKTDPAVFRPTDGVWYMLTKANAFNARQWGTNGDIPAAGDYNGDGKTDLALFRQSTGIWYIANSDSLNTYSYANWGISGDRPVVGDYDGDGKADIAVWRPSNGRWYVLRSSGGGFMSTEFGVASDMPAQGDIDGDGKTDLVVYRPSEGGWYVFRSGNGAVDFYRWGLSGDVPVTADYDGDGKSDISVFRPSDGVWYVLRSSGGFSITNWGLANDAPVPHAYMPQ